MCDFLNSLPFFFPPYFHLPWSVKQSLNFAWTASASAVIFCNYGQFVPKVLKMWLLTTGAASCQINTKLVLYSALLKRLLNTGSASPRQQEVCTSPANGVLLRGCISPPKPTPLLSISVLLKEMYIYIYMILHNINVSSFLASYWRPFDCLLFRIFLTRVIEAKTQGFFPTLHPHPKQCGI